MPTAETWLTCAVSANKSISKPRGASRRAGWGDDGGEEMLKHTTHGDRVQSVHQLSPWGQLFLSTVLNHTWVKCWWGVKCSEHEEKVIGYLEPLSFPHQLITVWLGTQRMSHTTQAGTTTRSIWDMVVFLCPGKWFQLSWRLGIL